MNPFIQILIFLIILGAVCIAVVLRGMRVGHKEEIAYLEAYILQHPATISNFEFILSRFDDLVHRSDEHLKLAGLWITVKEKYHDLMFYVDNELFVKYVILNDKITGFEATKLRKEVDKSLRNNNFKKGTRCCRCVGCSVHRSFYYFQNLEV